MNIYLFIFSLLLLLSYPKDLKQFFYPTVIILFLFSSFRGIEVDRDHANYIELITLASNNLSYPIEPGFKILSFISVNIFGGYFFVFLAFAFISIYYKAKAIRLISPYPMLSLLLLFSNVYLLHDFTQIRAAAAGAISCYALTHLIKDNKNKFLLYIVFASIFHYSALGFLIALLFKKNNISLLFIIMYLLSLSGCYLLYYLNINLLNIINFINIPYIKNKYLEYAMSVFTDEYVKVNVYSFVQLSHIFISLFLLLSSYRIKFDASELILLKLYSLAPICLVLFSFVPAFSLRMSELFSILEILILPFFVRMIKQKFCMKTFIVLVATAMIYIHLFHVNLLNQYNMNF
ncbi:EpsG family protein [Escherichia coli]|nr:EpsG family protein [Escherichia coli]